MARTGRPNTSLAGRWRPIFIAALRETGCVSSAIKTCGVSRKTAYASRNRSESFAKEWDDACEEAADTLEGVAFKRAREGWVEPVDPKKPAAHRRAYPPSDKLLEFLLRHLKPEKYGWKQQIQLTGADGGPVQMSEADHDNLKLLSADPEAMAAMRILAERKQALQQQEAEPDSKPVQH